MPDPERVRIEVEDGGAAYPLVIDPLLTNTRRCVLDATTRIRDWNYVTSIGDVNGDGYGDVMVGTHYGFVFLGGASGIASAGIETAATELPGHAESGQNMAGSRRRERRWIRRRHHGVWLQRRRLGRDLDGEPVGIATENHDHIYCRA